jgi:hypothetical protein
LATGHVADALRQLAIVHARGFRFEAGELVKLLDRTGHYETATGVMVAELVFVRNNVTVLIRKDGPVCECERVAIEIETRGWSSVSR